MYNLTYARSTDRRLNDDEFRAAIEGLDIDALAEHYLTYAFDYTYDGYDVRMGVDFVETVQDDISCADVDGDDMDDLFEAIRSVVEEIILERLDDDDE